MTKIAMRNSSQLGLQLRVSKREIIWFSPFLNDDAVLARQGRRRIAGPLLKYDHILVVQGTARNVCAYFQEPRPLSKDILGTVEGRMIERNSLAQLS
jgi:hypothetical protein